MTTVMFWILAPLGVAAATGVVVARKAVYSAMFLGATMIILAVSYIALDAPFLGVVQIVVYTGAVMMLFLFVLMLIGVDSADDLAETLRGQRVVTVLAGLGFGILLIAGIGTVATTGFVGLTEADAASTGHSASLASEGNVQGLATLIFTRDLWAFELTSALLITAALGAMVLTHRERFERRKTQRELVVERFETGARATPLPNPGVYALHNAVNTLARLPDGSDCELSVSRTLTRDGTVLTLLVAPDRDEDAAMNKEASQ